MKTHQGSSKYTVRKEFEIEGLTTMRLNQFKNKYFHSKKIICADIFCGSGTNVLPDQTEIDGSPIKLIKGYLKAKGGQHNYMFPSFGEKNNNYTVDFWFSDIRQMPCDRLKKRIESEFGLELEARKMAASDAINVLGDRLAHDPDRHLFAIIDPNGPKDFPVPELSDLISVYSKRVDVIPNISATAFNRCLGARNKAGRQLNWWIAGIENFTEGFVLSMSGNGRKGLIRVPDLSDNHKWTMIPTFGRFKPKHPWLKQGYVFIDSEEGKQAIQHYCGRF